MLEYKDMKHIIDKIKGIFTFPKKTQNAFLRDQRGITLLEILLVVGVFGSLSVGIITLTNTFAEQERIERAATHLRIVHAAADAYINDNFTILEAALFASGIPVEVPLNDPNPVNAPDLDDYLKKDGIYLPVNYSPNNVFGQDLTVLVRRVSATQLEGMVVSEGRAISLDSMVQVAKSAGAIAGLVVGADIGGFDDAAFTGAFGGWSVPLTSYAALGWNAANPRNADTAHLAARIIINEAAAIDNFLYRVDITGQPEANRMAVDLNMNNNTFDNAVAMIADRVVSTSNMVVNAPVMNIDDGLGVEGNIDVTGALRVQGSINLGALIATGDINAGNSVTADSVDGAGTTEIDSGQMGVSASVEADTISARDIAFSGTSSILSLNDQSIMNTTNMTGVITGDVSSMGVTQMTSGLVEVSGSFTSEGSVNITGAGSSADFGSNVSISDTGGNQGDFDPANGSNVNLNASIGAITNCATTTNGICN